MTEPVRRGRGDDGFTLPELLVVIVVTAIIMPVLFTAFATGVRTMSGTTERLAASNDAEWASTYFVPDVQAADSFGETDLAACAKPAGSNLLFTVTRSTGPVTVITGYATAPSGTDQTLVRYRCENGASVQVTTVAGTLDPAQLATKTCLPSPCGAVTRQVTLNVHDVSGYGYTLTATRRTS